MSKISVGLKKADVIGSEPWTLVKLGNEGMFGPHKRTKDLLARNGPCAGGAPPRMKRDRMAEGCKQQKDRFDTRAVSRTNNVIWMPASTTICRSHMGST